MKFCLSLIGFFLISIALISPTQAVFINSKLDSSLIQETGIAKLVEKVIFSPTKIQNILNKSNEKYAQEIAYYFSKQGFKRSPAS